MEIDTTTLNSFFAALSALILIIIAYLNKIRTDSAATTAAATSATATTNAAIAATEKTAVAQITATTVSVAPANGTVWAHGPWHGDKEYTTIIGTRILVNDNTLAFQVVDDRIAKGFPIATSGPNSLAAPTPWAFGGNLSLVFHGQTF